MYVQSFGHASKQTTNGVARTAHTPKRYTQHEVLITPDYAKELLAMSAGNRNLSRGDLKYFVELMKSGKWVNNGQGIAISVPTPERPNGTLLDGHTRLTACTIAGVPFESDIKWNLPLDAMNSLDSGTSRRPNHHLQIMGIRNAVKVSATFTKYHAYKNKYHFSQFKPHASAMKVETAAWWRENPYADISLIEKSRTIMNGSCAQVAYILIREAGCRQDIVDEFFDGIIKGVGLEEGNPILTLRNGLTRHDIKNLGLVSTSAHRYIAMIIRMFNYWVEGKPCSRLFPPQTGDYIQPIIPAHARVNS